jgi:hypothetical protein
MAFLDFLLRPKAGAPAPTIEDMEAKLLDLHQERERSSEFLAGLEARRNEMLIDDKPASEISKLDVEADSARIAIEKSELFESELLSRLAVLHGAEAETAWRSGYDQMHSCALTYAESLRASLAELYKFRAAAEGLNGFGYGMRRPEAPPVVLGSEILERWLRDFEQDHDFEMNRRARQSHD